MNEPLDRRSFLTALGATSFVGGAGVHTTTASTTESSSFAAIWHDPIGDDHGPGDYRYPTGEPFHDGAFDLVRVALERTEEGWKLTAEVDDLRDPGDGEYGFSLQYLQVYVRDPAAPDADAATDACEGVNVTFEAPYHRRLLVDGYRGARIETGTGDPIDGLDDEPAVSAALEDDELVVSLPDGVFESDPSDLQIAPLLCGYDSDALGFVRQVTPERSERTFGGGRDDEAIPNVIDLVTPLGTRQTDALAYGEDERATVPYVSAAEGTWQHAFSDTALVRWRVSPATDHGPGDYEYPDDLPIDHGDLDLVSVATYRTDDRYTVLFEVAGDVVNSQEQSTDPSVHFPQVYLRDPLRDDGTTIAREGVNATFEDPYQYRIVGHPDGGVLEDASGTELATATVESPPEVDAIRLSIPADAIDDDLEHMQLAALMLAYAEDEPGSVRPVTADGLDDDGDQRYFAGGRDDDANPNVIDLATPDRDTALAYAEDNPAKIPYHSVRRKLLTDRLDGEEVLFFTDERGTAYGPGWYDYPEDVDIDPSMLDLRWVSLFESDDSYTFVISVFGGFMNKNKSTRGYSFIFPQIYFRDSMLSGGSVDALPGVNSAFNKQYFAYLSAPPFDTRHAELSFKNHDGSEITEDLHVTTLTDIDAIKIQADMLNADLDLSSVQFSTLITAYINNQTGSVRPVVEESHPYIFSGGDEEMSPNVIDLLTPPGVSQREALDYSEDERATIPFRSLSVRESIVGHREPTDEHVSRAVEHWRTADPVPGTDGERARYATVRELYLETS